MGGVLGVDPGLSGALVIVDEDEIYVLDMPVLEKGKTKIVNGAAIADFIEEHEPTQAVIEHVRTHGAGDMASPAAVAKMSFALGVVVGSIAAMLVPYELVQASVWKPQMGLKNKEKKASHALACQMAPQFSKHFTGPRGGALVDRAEAFLLSAWWQRKNGVLTPRKNTSNSRPSASG